MTYVLKSGYIYFRTEASRLTHKADPDQTGPEVIKLFSCSVEQGILNAHKYKNIKKFAFLGSDKPRMLFFPTHKC